MPADSRRLLYPLSAAIILAYFLFFTWRSVSLYFDPDDMMNLYFVWTKPWAEVLKANLFYWSDFYRPMGGLYYRTLFALAGFDPLPFRIVCLTLGVFNLGLCFWFIRLIGASDRTAALGTLIFAFHPRLIEVWYRNSVIYDLLCFTFVYLAACLCIGGRRWRTLPILLCYVAALDTKEMAVSLPVILLGWELLFNRGSWRRFWLIGVMGLMNLPYVYAKTHGSSLLANNPFYKPEYSWDRFTHSWAVYINYILVRESITPVRAIAILAALLIVAVALRSKLMVFAWVIIFFGTLPVSFIPYRGGFVLYLSWTGWALYAATALVALQDLLLRKWPRHRTALACAVFFLVGWRGGKLYLHEQRQDPRRWLYDPPAKVQALVTQMRAMHPSFPTGAKILFLEDGFSTDEWTPYFIMKLAWQDDTMTVDRAKMMAPNSPAPDHYSYVFTYDKGVYRQIQ